MPTNVELLGTGELVERLNLMVANADKIGNSALKEAATPIQKDAQQSTAFHDASGDLRKGIKLSAIKKHKKYKYKYIAVFTKNPVAHLVEWGHAGPQPAPPHPFLAPAYERHKKEARDIIVSRLREALR